jgi:hypothetical protein
MFTTVIILMGIPITLGILFNYYFPNIAKKVIFKPFRIFSFFAFIGFIVMAFANNFDHFLNYIPPIFVIVLIHNTLGFFTGWSFAKLLKRPLRDIRTIALETGIQNSALGLILIFNPENISARPGPGWNGLHRRLVGHLAYPGRTGPRRNLVAKARTPGFLIPNLPCRNEKSRKFLHGLLHRTTRGSTSASSTLLPPHRNARPR